MPTRFAAHLHLRHGGLHGWCERCPPSERHAALERSVHADGYATTVHRLSLLVTLSKTENPGLHRTAEEDMEWLHEHHGGA